MAKYKTTWKPSTALKAVEEGQRFQLEFGNSDSWLDYANWYRGNFGDEDYFYNLYYIFVRSILPSIYYRDPHINVIPLRTFGPDPDPTRQIGSLVLQSVDNILLRRMNLKATIRDIIFDTLQASRGAVKIGYAATKEEGEYNTELKNKMPWVARVSPNQFIVPFGARRLKQIPWVCNILLRYTTDVQQSTLYKGAKEIEGSHINLLQKWLDSNKLKEFSEDAELCELHEFYDMRTREIMTYLPTGNIEQSEQIDEKWLREPTPDNLMKVLGGELPFEDLCFNEDPDFFWGPSDFRQLEPIQTEVNETREQCRQHRQISLLRFMYQSEMIEKDELEKFMNADQPGIGIKVKGDPARAIAMVTAHMPPDLPAWSMANREDAREITGVGKQQAGITQGGRKTAREVMTAQMGFDTRVGERRDAVADFIQRVMQKVNKVIGYHWEVEDVVPVVGVDGALYWVEFNNKIMKGDFGVQIDADELSPMTLMQRRQDIMQLAQNLSGAGVPMDYLLRKLLSLYDDVDLQSILPPGNNGQVMPAGAFQAQQAAMPQDQRAAGAALSLNRLSNASPQLPMMGQEQAFSEGM